MCRAGTGRQFFLLSFLQLFRCGNLRALGSIRGGGDASIFCICTFAASRRRGLRAETITYSYDARGRLIQVARTGAVNNNVTTNYAYDKADNRSSKATTGSPNPPPP